MQPCADDEADILIGGIPWRLETVHEYFLAKHCAAWRAKVEPVAPDWETLGDRLGVRWGKHVWWAGWWDGKG